MYACINTYICMRMKYIYIYNSTMLQSRLILTETNPFNKSLYHRQIAWGCSHIDPSGGVVCQTQTQSVAQPWLSRISQTFPNLRRHSQCEFYNITFDTTDLCFKDLVDIWCVSIVVVVVVEFCFFIFCFSNKYFHHIEYSLYFQPHNPNFEL